MSDLSVTDVQKALREHAEMGHIPDLSSRTTEYLGNKYGMSVGHHLEIYSEDPEKMRPYNPRHYSTLISHIQQSERPLMTWLDTSIMRQQGKRDSKTWLGRLGVPVTWQNDTHGYSVIGQSEKSNFLVDEKSLGRKDIHSIIKSHASAKLPFIGLDFTPEEGVKEITNYKDLQSRWNEQKALQSLSPTGMSAIYVRHHPNYGNDTPWHEYAYHPESEKLIKL